MYSTESHSNVNACCSVFALMVSLNVSMLLAMFISELVFSNVCTDTSWASSNLVGFD